jgi:hypothetical protein
MKDQYLFLQTPTPLRRTRLHNLTLVPGDLLPYRAEWQAVANTLPRGAVLIVVPSHNPLQKQTMLAVAKLLSGDGHQVRVIPAADLSRRQSPDHAHQRR